MNKLPKLTIEGMATIMADGDFYTASELGRNKPWLDVAVVEQNLPKATINKIDFYHRPSLDKLVEKNVEDPPVPGFTHQQVSVMIRDAVDAALKEQLGYNPNTLKPTRTPSVILRTEAKAKTKTNGKTEEQIDTEVYISTAMLGFKYGIPAGTISEWCKTGKIPAKWGRDKGGAAKYWVNPNDQKVLAYIEGYPARRVFAANIGQRRAS